ncbi:MAG TPA: isocitrate/isopropylmalate family dehydrogenase [Bacteroidia bacterium]|nr:isocitrate/isopropylmalate family dehydrogenase [Bacteroidia bacterium]
MAKYKVSVAKGDGIGPEIMDAVISIFDAAKVDIEYEYVDMGKDVFLKGHSTGMTDEAERSIEANGILFKGPMETPKGKGMKSINVTARKVWSTFANKRRFQTLEGVETVYSKAGIPIDITIIRENIEGTYGGIEHLNTSDVALCRRFISRPGSAQVHRFAFELARRQGNKSVVCGHKANIMKVTDGMFLETFYEVAKDYPEIEAKDVIIDDLCMKLVVRPNDYEIVVLTNLQGDIVSDLCAGLVGGLGFAPSANIGERVSIFEAVHGTAPDIAGKNIANPTSLLLSGIMMLRHLGFYKEADSIENSLLYTLESGVHTGDFGDKSTPAKNTTEFAQEIIKNMGQLPTKTTPRRSPAMEYTWMKPVFPEKQPMLKSNITTKKTLVGADYFIESDELADEIAAKILPLIPEGFELQTISNRGTQVWPTGSILTECVNHYCMRIMAKGPEGTTQPAIFDIAKIITEHYYITSTEMLVNFGDLRGYSLVAGQ